MTKREENTLRRINLLEGLANQIMLEAAMLRKEVLDSGASITSSRKGLSDEERSKILGRRAKNRIK